MIIIINNKYNAQMTLKLILDTNSKAGSMENEESQQVINQH